MARNLNVRNAVKLALAVNAGLVGFSAAPVALAQQDPGAGELEEVVVTGSRIRKKDFTSNAPVATVGFEQIELTGTVNTESLLNTLPQTVPGLDRTSNNPGNGTATVDLRGLGSIRTLVLINGTRVVPTGSGGSVDINSIPNALIQNIEVLTGGASAVYGSDAVAGVVNFILKDDFEGVNVNAGYEITQEGDAGIISADITLGANVADGRGNVTFNFAYTDRDDLFQGDRDFAFFAQFDNADATGLIDGGSSGIPGTSIFSGALDQFSPDSLGVTFDSNGDIRPFITTGDNNDFYNYAPVNYIQLPQTRYQSTALGHFDISDNATVYGRAMFTSSKVPQQLAPTPIFQSGTQVTLDGNPFLTAQSQQVLSDAFGDGVDTDADGIDDTGTMFVRRRMLEVGPRIVDASFTSFQMQAGLRGDLTDSWSYDAYLQTGNVNIGNTQLGNISRARFQQALLLDISDPTGNTCSDSSSNGATSNCAPINIWGEGNISEAGAAFVRTAVSSTADFDQLVTGITLTGDIGGFELPGGAIGAAIGVEHIENDFAFRPSQALASGEIAGFNGAPAVEGGFDVDSAYIELYLPILSGESFAELLDVELAYRSSDYSTAGSVSSSKISASWAPNDQFRIRGGFNQAIRAPSIGELFAPLGENFPGATDPCAAEGPNSGDPAVQAICVATGVPSGVVGSPAINLPAGQVRSLVGGNPGLTEESADTYTYGIVVTPAAVEGLTFSLDYFDIVIEDVVAQFGGSATNVLNTCYDPANPLGGVGSPFCNVINRRADGTIEFISLQSQNAAELSLNGFDLLASYDMDLWGGDFRINYVGTFTQESDFIAFAGDTPIECAGNYGNLCGEPTPEYKHRMTFRWTGDNITAQLLWRQVGEVTDDDPGTAFTVEKIDSQAYFDASGTYRFSDSYAVTLGIDNLLDEEPPILGDNQEQANTWPATYDVFGRTFFLRATADF
ncbi:MAG: TonB-dependent receptor [Woeseiaceae bacterium]|nr:TonB-dependent receptor [Woeseiaceae bacterium]